jgi:hypothetical protein
MPNKEPTLKRATEEIDDDLSRGSDFKRTISTESSNSSPSSDSSTDAATHEKRKHEEEPDPRKKQSSMIEEQAKATWERTFRTR